MVKFLPKNNKSHEMIMMLKLKSIVEKDRIDCNPIYMRFLMS